MTTGRRLPAALALAALLLTAAACGGSDDPGSSGRSPGAGGAPDAPDAPDPIPDSVRAELVRLGEADQTVREGLTTERLQDTTFLRTMLAGDSARSLRLRAIVDRWGWPDSVSAGPEAASAAFLVLQHTPLDGFKAAMLPRLEAAARDGAVPAPDVAMLVDRVLVERGDPQRYGTQLSLVGDTLVADPVEDLDGLDERRRAMGLPPMGDYLRLLEEQFQGPVIGPTEAATDAGG